LVTWPQLQRAYSRTLKVSSQVLRHNQQIIFFTGNDNIFSLNASTQINLYKAKSKNFYNLPNVKIHTEDQTGPKLGTKTPSLKKDVWTKIFKSLKTICTETKLKEFQFKLIHRAIVTKKELFRFGIKEDDECLYCGDKDSIEHSFIECMFTKLFTQGLELVQPSERVPNFSYHRGDLVRYYCKLPRHNNNTEIQPHCLIFYAPLYLFKQVK